MVIDIVAAKTTAWHYLPSVSSQSQADPTVTVRSSIPHLGQIGFRATGFATGQRFASSSSIRQAFFFDACSRLFNLERKALTFGGSIVLSSLMTRLRRFCSAVTRKKIVISKSGIAKLLNFQTPFRCFYNQFQLHRLLAVTQLQPFSHRRLLGTKSHC